MNKILTGIPHINLDIFKNLFPASKELVGLDIGSHSLKLIELVETPKQGYVLNRFSQIPVEKGVLLDGVPVEQQELAFNIKELFHKSKCKRRGVVTSLSGHSIVVKKVSFPTMDEEELRDLIGEEIGKYLPFENTKDVNVDFQILGENEYNPNLMDVILVAAKSDIVNSFADVVREAGLTPMIMDVDSFALETMYEQNYDFEENEMDILINIGASMTNINVVRGGVSVFTRDFTLAGNAITEAIQQTRGVDFEEAEKLKIEGPIGSDSVRGEFKNSLLAYADPICTEIERSVDYFRSTFGAEDIKHILLSGGTALIPGIVGDLSRRLSIETEIINPFKKISVSQKVLDPAALESIGPIAAVGIGLALRKVGDK